MKTEKILTFQGLRNEGKRLLRSNKIKPSQVEKFNEKIKQYKKNNDWERDIQRKLNYTLIKTQ